MLSPSFEISLSNSNLSMILRKRQATVLTVIFITSVYLALMSILFYVLKPLRESQQEQQQQQQQQQQQPKNNYMRQRLSSSCSDESSQFTSGQNVIAFSYFEPESVQQLRRSQGANYSPIEYELGIYENLERMRQLYPGFVTRVYTDVTLEGEFEKMVRKNPDLQWCDIRKTPSHGDLSSMFFMTWRFMVLGDPTVDIFLSRDLDSILTEREQAAVADWLNATNKSLHSMRDNVNHIVPMLGGLWGGSNSRLLEAVGSTSIKRTIASMITESKRGHNKGFDQGILEDVIYSPYKDHVVSHDSYLCDSYTELIRPFPVQRKNAKSDFVGNPALGKAEYYLPECPEVCRPSYGKDWLYC